MRLARLALSAWALGLAPGAALAQQCCPTENLLCEVSQALTLGLSGSCQTCCPPGLKCGKVGCRKTPPPVSTFGGTDTCTCTLGAGCSGDCGRQGDTGGGCADAYPYRCSDNGGVSNNDFCCGLPYCCQGGRGGCASSLEACEQQAGPACPPETPVSCGNGQCCGADQVCCHNGKCCPAKQPVCTSKGCCPTSAPYGCPTDGTCRNSPCDCPGGRSDGYATVAGLNGEKACCPVEYPYPCADGTCDQVPNCYGRGLLGSVRPSTGSGGGGVCSASNPAATCETYRTGCARCSVSSCAIATGGVACGFYKTSDGKSFGTQCGTDSTCMQNAGRAAVCNCCPC